MQFITIAAAMFCGILAAPLPKPSEPHTNPLAVDDLNEYLGIFLYTVDKAEGRIQAVSFFIGFNADNIYAYCHQDGITTYPSVDTACTLASKNSPTPFSTRFRFRLTEDDSLTITDWTASDLDHKPYTANVKAPSVTCKHHNSDAGAGSQVCAYSIHGALVCQS